MKIEHRALLQTVGIIAGIISASLLTSFVLSIMTLQIGMYLLGIVLFGIFGSLIYSIVLGRLKYEQTLNDLNKSA